jgi:hypothetical protein
MKLNKVSKNKNVFTKSCISLLSDICFLGVGKLRGREEGHAELWWGKAEGKKPLGRTRRCWEEEILKWILK